MNIVLTAGFEDNSLVLGGLVLMEEHAGVQEPHDDHPRPAPGGATEGRLPE